VYSIDENGDMGERQLAAVDFYPPQSGAASTFFIDNFKFSGGGGDNFAVMDVTPTEITVGLPVGGTTSVPVTVANTGTSMGDYFTWAEIDFEPTTGTSNYTVTYSGDFVGGAVGYPDECTIEVAAKYPLSYYCDKVGTYINKVAFYMYQAAGNNKLTARVYGVGAYNVPGDILAEATISNPVVGGWNEITLSTPVLLGGQDICVAVEMLQPAGGYLMTYDETGIATENTNWTRRNGGGWSQMLLVQGEPTGIIMIKAYAQGGVVPACWIAPKGDSYGSVPMNSSKTYNVAFNATGLELGKTYSANIFVATSDEEKPLFTIPCTLLVGEFPLISVAPNSIEESFPEDAENKTVTVTLTVANSGSGEGSYEAKVVEVVDWLTLEGDTQGDLPIGESKTFDAVIDATDLAIGNYNATIAVTTNDLTNPLINVPCKLVIKQGIEVYINGVETKVYPNPATNMINVESNITMSSIQIINHVGQVVSSSVVNDSKTTVNTSNLSAGYYFVKVNTEKGSRSIKFVVK
jgi:hypothetical protein